MLNIVEPLMHTVCEQFRKLWLFDYSIICHGPYYRLEWNLLSFHYDILYELASTLGLPFSTLLKQY